MLTIAILSLIGFVLDVLNDCIKETLPTAKLTVSSIMVISWWNINFPTAIVLLCFAAIWTLVVILIRLVK